MTRSIPGLNLLYSKRRHLKYSGGIAPDARFEVAFFPSRLIRMGSLCKGAHTPASSSEEQKPTALHFRSNETVLEEARETRIPPKASEINATLLPHLLSL